MDPRFFRRYIDKIAEDTTSKYQLSESEIALLEIELYGGTSVLGLANDLPKNLQQPKVLEQIKQFSKVWVDKMIYIIKNETAQSTDTIKLLAKKYIHKEKISPQEEALAMKQLIDIGKISFKAALTAYLGREIAHEFADQHTLLQAAIGSFVAWIEHQISEKGFVNGMKMLSLIVGVNLFKSIADMIEEPTSSGKEIEQKLDESKQSDLIRQYIDILEERK